VLLLLSVFLSGCGAAQVAENWPGLTLAGDTIYVISGAPQKVYMLDVETGAQKGVFVPQGELKGVPYWSPVAVGGGLAFVGFVDPQSNVAGLYAFDPETGQELWNIPAEDLIIPAPVYAGGVVYFGSSDGRLYAVDVETRSVKPGWPFETGEAIWGSPLVAGERVYVASQDHHLYCLDAETGEMFWKHQVGGAMAGQPTLDAARGIVYVGAFDAKVYAVDADTGERFENFDFKAENWIWSKPLLGDDQIYVSSLDGNLYALDPESGAVIPPYPYNSGEIDDRNDSLRASPVHAGDFVIVAAESGRVIAVQDAGRRWLWPSGQPETGVLTTPVVSEDKDTIYVVLMNGDVQALSAETGTQLWTFSAPTED
jgi:outer membrane protein assembly factor BamB